MLVSYHVKAVVAMVVQEHSTPSPYVTVTGGGGGAQNTRACNMLSLPVGRQLHAHDEPSGR
jgi:hypothetical protein